jgi:outer membrane lipoprotein LolB
MRLLHFLPALLGLIVAACSTLPQSPAVTLPPAQYQAHLQQISKIRYFAIHGRIAVLTEAKGFSGGLRWHHHSEGDDVDFYSPLGSQLGKLTRDASGVTLTTSNQKTLHANDAEALTQKALGWSLPMDGLTDWMLGRPAQGKSEVLAWDNDGNITHMKQQGWDIQYSGYTDFDGIALPEKITLKSQKLDLKLVVETWQTDTE